MQSNYIQKQVKQTPASSSIIHTTIGVYANGEYKVNGVTPEDLQGHIEYNKQFRHGRALLVDGKVVHNGYYSNREADMLEEKFKFTKATYITKPYQ